MTTLISVVCAVGVWVGSVVVAARIGYVRGGRNSAKVYLQTIRNASLNKIAPASPIGAERKAPR